MKRRSNDITENMDFLLEFRLKISNLMCEKTAQILVSINYQSNAYDHTTLNAPVLVRSPKLSNVGPG